MKNSNKFLKISKKITSALLCVALISPTVSFMASEPLRASFEAEGAEVSWDEENGVVRLGILGNIIILEPNSNIALINGNPIELSQSIFIQNGVSFIEMADILAISNALEDVPLIDLSSEMSPLEGELALSIATAKEMATQFMELAYIPDVSIAIVNANTDFSWAETMSEATDAHTIFHLGSIAKTFTAVGVMQLVEQGLLNLDTPIIEYLPEFSILPSLSGEGDYRNITARMLLSHTAGIYPSDFGSGFLTTNGHYEDAINGFLERFSNFRMVREEGISFEYANNGFVILGILVASIAGYENYFEGFNQFMLENVFEPMGLSHTSYLLREEHMPFVATPYTMAGVPSEIFFTNSLATGSMFSSANDMISLMTMFLNDGYYNGHQILTSESIDLMFTKHDGNNYGLGVAFMADPTGSGLLFEGHNGALVHNFAAMFLDRENGIGVFSATNSISSSGLNEVLAGSVMVTALSELGVEIAPPVAHIDLDATPLEMSSEELEAFTGLYLFTGGMLHAFIRLIDGELRLILPQQNLDTVLTPMSDGHFSSDVGIPFWLTQDGEGNVTIGQGANRYVTNGARVDIEQFIPDEDFMENWSDFTFKAHREQDFYVSFIPTITFGITEDGLAYSESVIINMLPGTTLIMLESMDQNIELQYEDGEHFFYYMGIRFVRQPR